jgi:hypothetical protein
VEAVSVRSIRLRDLAGTVHTVPFRDFNRLVKIAFDEHGSLLATRPKLQ